MHIKTYIFRKEQIMNGNDVSTDISSGTGQQGPATNRPPQPNGSTTNGVGETQYAFEEVQGDPYTPPPDVETGVIEFTSAELHTEVGQEGTEAATAEFAEATPQQIAAETGEESDLKIPSSESQAYESRPASDGVLALQEAGTAIEAGQGGPEFWSVLAKVVPTLVSTIGPAVAKGVMKKLSPRAKTVIRRLPTVAANAASAAGKPAAGSNILALIAKLLQSAENAPMGEAATAVEEALIEETVQVLEVIVDIDDRTRIRETRAIPWRWYCALRITFPSGAIYRGTGFFVGARAVVTAGHCVFLKNHGWARQIEVIPGCDGNTRPYGQAIATSFRSVQGWVKHSKPDCDYGFIRLSQAFAGNLGSFACAAFDSQALLAQKATLAGYPGDKPFAELWGAERFLKTVTEKTLIYNTASVAGQSGAPVYIKRNGQRYVVGIHNYGASTGNSATRITPAVYENIMRWRNI
jgi:V8-like Glu-specific endopeptidase